MDFFENQANAKKKTFSLVFYFIMAIVLIIAAIDAVVIGALLYVKWDKDMVLLGGLRSTGNQILDLCIIVTLIISPLVIGFIVIGTLLKLYTLRHGGISVAEMVNARPISPDTQNLQEKKFLNVVEEMSIASGVRIPKLYIMDNEPGINAFVAGMKPEDTVMVVTKGALDQLNRDELQGVVGHEFSHIFNNDMQISLRLMGILGGLLVIGQTGYFLLRTVGRGRMSGKSSRSNGKLMLVLLSIGLGLFVIGYIGLFFGRLIKAAVSRQRELLADASAVQYSRNPAGLVGALRQIQQSEMGTHLETKNAEDINHLCFCPSMSMLFTQLLASHPPIEQRIKILDPKNEYSPTKPKKMPPQPTSEKTSSQFSNILLPILMGSAIQSDLQSIKNTIGEPTTAHMEMAKKLISLIPTELLALAHSKEGVALLLYAMIAPNDKDKINQVLSHSLTSEAIEQVCKIQEKIKQLPPVTLLPLLEIALPAFKANDENLQNTLLKTIENLIAFNNDNLFQFALHSIISKSTQRNSLVENTKYQKFDDALSDVSILLALVINYSHNGNQKNQAYFDQLIKPFTTKPIAYPDITNYPLMNLQMLLARLNRLSPQFKEKLIQASLQCIEHDKKITAEEAEIVRAIASLLDCPIPPIIPSIG